MGNECWNSVTIYGPAAEIKRFHQESIDLPPGSDPLNAWNGGGWGGYPAEIGFKGVVPGNSERGPRYGLVEYVSNYREHAPEPESWMFAFDTATGFPEDVFEELAPLFPALHFDCECIDSMDDYCGYGWFNIPPGGEAFRQDMKVPRNYWTTGTGFKRTPTAQARHDALVDALTQAAHQADRGVCGY